jgi:hypothetical protein
MNLYILENKEVKKISDCEVKEWLEWQDKHKAECVVAFTRLLGVTVRTRFEGCDTSGSNRPFVVIVDGRTMYGGGRATTWEEAEEFHQRVCDRIENEKKIEFRRLAHKEHKNT